MCAVLGRSWPMLLLLAACGRPGADDGRTVFRFNQYAALTNLDPAFSSHMQNEKVCDQFFDGLVEMGADLRVRPAIAARWTIADSGRLYTFHLRQDVWFHDSEAFPDGRGRLVTAQDFRYSFERIRDPRVASPGRWVFEHVVPGPEGFQVIDDSTFAVRLVRPFAPFIGILCMVYTSVVPREAVEHFGTEWRSRPVGAGPFRFFHWEEGVKLAMRRNERYYQRDEAGEALPYLDAIAISFVKDRNAEFLGLVKGEFDMMSGVEGSALNEMLDPLGRIRPKYADRIRLIRTPSLETSYLGFLMDSVAMRNSPWRDVRLRRAVNMAIDRQRIISHIQHGIGVPAHSIIPPALPGASGRGRGYDATEARRLLAEAGFPDGQGLPVLTVATTSTGLELCEFIQHDLAAFGIRLAVDVLPLSTHISGVANREHPFFRKNWSADYPDAENFLMLFVGANSTPAGPNYTCLRNSTMDRLYAEALSVVDDNMRIALYERMDSLVVAEAPAIFLTHNEVALFVRHEVRGLEAHPMSRLDLCRVRKEPVAQGAGR
ncbi:MAG: ABC transporter substrate-binding protein [Flavobacteriales bacterium]|nr:ABC transporter substrate-binding protein [Flavobacteriales bacterium]